jgi:hypothetical protein
MTNREAPRGGITYCCYGMYAEVGHSADCPTLKSAAQPEQAREAVDPVGINGLTEAETSATASVAGLSSDPLGVPASPSGSTLQPPAAASASIVGAAVCPNCGGAGDETFLTSHLGPDDYEFDGPCSHCGGTGELSDAYAGVVKLLEESHREYLSACRRLWAVGHARLDQAGWRYRVGSGTWVYTENASDIPTREHGCEWQPLYPPLRYDSIARGIEPEGRVCEAPRAKPEEPGAEGTRPDQSGLSAAAPAVEGPKS